RSCKITAPRMRTARQPSSREYSQRRKKASAPAQDYSVCRWHARRPFPPAETSACPAVGQLGNRLDDLFGKRARTFCRYLHRGRPARVPNFVPRFVPSVPRRLSWRERDQQPLANQGTNSGTHPREVPAARLKAEAHLCTAAYL